MNNFATAEALHSALKGQVKQASLTDVRFHVNHKNAAGTTVSGSVVVLASGKVEFYAGTSTTAKAFASFDQFVKDPQIAPKDAWRCALSADSPAFRSSFNGKTDCQISYYSGIELFRRKYDISATTWQPFWTVVKVDVLGDLPVAIATVAANNNNANNRTGTVNLGRNTETLGQYGRAWDELRKFLDDAIEKILKPPSEWRLHYTQTFDTPESWKSFAYFRVQEITQSLPQPLELVPFAKEWCKTAFHVKSSAAEGATVEQKYKQFHLACRSTNTLCRFTVLVLSLVDARMEKKDKLSMIINESLKHTLHSNTELSTNLKYALLLQRKAQLLATSTDISFRFDTDICDVLNEARAGEERRNKAGEPNPVPVAKAIESGFSTYIAESTAQFNQEFITPFLSGQLPGLELMARWAQMIATDKAIAAKLNLNYYEVAAEKVKKLLGRSDILEKLLGTELKPILVELRQQPLNPFSIFVLGDHIDGVMFRCVMSVASVFGDVGVRAVQAVLKEDIRNLFSRTIDRDGLQAQDKAILMSDTYRFHVEKFLQLESFLKQHADNINAAPGNSLWGAVDSFCVSLSVTRQARLRFSTTPT